ncbi:MAG: hypothetical protein K8F36_13090 [Melioribacteraceae bacterium]|nr:hypothetical protein [Melioribacteraceae bacterium]
MNNKALFLFSFFLIGIIGCSNSSENNCICTQEFRSYSVFIADENLVGIDSLVTQSKNRQTGEKYQISQSWSMDKGMYVVMDDSHTLKFSGIPTQVIFTAKKGEIDIEADYFFNTDDCKCHINKVSGPDTIVVR